MNKTRTSFRPRPLDINKQLEIITDPEVSFDTTTEPVVAIAHSGAPDEAAGAKAKGKPKGHDIPIPVVTEVPTYKQDYLPTFREKTTYIRASGGTGQDEPPQVEYDLDEADMEWLEGFNGGQDRLPADRFERMLWILDLTNAKAIERTFTAAGADQASRNTHSVVSAIDHMPPEEAFAALAHSVPARDRTQCAVYEYWQSKRKLLGRPLLRSLQAPTSASDSNWLNVFRPREKIHRPQTRRRKEAPGEALDKMKALKANLLKSRDICESINRRERKKFSIVTLEVDAAQLQLKLRHEPKASVDKIEADYLAQSKMKEKSKRPLGFEAQPGLAPGGVPPREGPNAQGQMPLLKPSEFRRNKRRKRDLSSPQADAVAHLPPPPYGQEVTFGLLAVECAPQLDRLSASYAHKQHLKAAAAAAAQASAAAAAAVSTRSGAVAAAAAAAAVASSGLPGSAPGPSQNGAAGGGAGGTASAALNRFGSSFSGAQSSGQGLVLPEGVEDDIAAGRACLRAARGGRLVIDRCHPVTYELLGPGAEDPLGGAPPMHTLHNPYVNGGLKSLTIRNAPVGNSQGSQGNSTPGGTTRSSSRKGPTPTGRGAAAAPVTPGSGTLHKRGPGRPPKGTRGGSPE